MKKIIASVICLSMLVIMVTPTYATKKTTAGKVIMPAKLVDSEATLKVTTPNGTITPNMDMGTVLFTMNFSNLRSDKMLTTINTHKVRKSNFTNSSMKIGTACTSSVDTQDLAVGLCYGDSNTGDFIREIYDYFPTSGSDTIYRDTSSLDPDITYYGFVHNESSSKVSGKASFYSMS